MADYRKTVEAFTRAMFIQRDPKAAAQVYAEDATLTEPAAPNGIRGLKAIQDNLAGYIKAFPDLSGETRNLFGSGEWFLAEFTLRGTHTGSLELVPGDSLPPTGRKVELPVAWVARINGDGKVTTDRTYYDAASLLQQLGVLGDQPAKAPGR